MKEKNYEKRYRILLGIIVILILGLFVFFIYSRVYKANILESYNQGQRDKEVEMINIIQNKLQIPKLFINENNQTEVRWTNAGDWFIELYNRNQNG